MHPLLWVIIPRLPPSNIKNIDNIDNTNAGPPTPHEYAQDYYDAQFSKGEAGPPAYVVFSDVDYFRAFDDDDARAAFHGVSTGLAQLQK